MRIIFTFVFCTASLSGSIINVVTQSTNALGGDPLGYYAPYGTISNPGVGAVSWTQTSTFNNVTLMANLFAVSGYSTAPSATFHLVNKIGAGSSASNVLAQGSVSLPVSPQLLTLGTVASLGPGTYYLVIDSSAPNSDWDYQYPGTPTLTTDPSVTFNADYSARGSSVNTSFTPASGFNSFFIPFDFSVTATSSPEPASLFLAAAGLSLVVWRKRRAFFSSRSS